MYLIIQNKQAFTAIETLVGFILFSSMMLLYLPAFTQSIQTYHHLNTQTKQWQLFYDLNQMQLLETPTIHLIQQYNESHEIQLIDYYLSDNEAAMYFSDDSQIIVSLIDAW